MGMLLPVMHQYTNDYAMADNNSYLLIQHRNKSVYFRAIMTLHNNLFQEVGGRLISRVGLFLGDFSRIFQWYLPTIASILH